MAVSSIPNNSGIGRGTTAQRPSAPPIGTPYFNGTTAELQIYTTTGWAAVNAPPFPVSSLAFVNTGGANAYTTTAGTGNITFTPNTGGGISNNFIVTPSPTTSPATFSGASSPIAVSNLLPGQLYTFSTVAVSNYGTSAPSSTTGTPTTRPQAPTLSSITQVGTTGWSLVFSNNQTGGSAITSMSITSSPSVALTYSGTTSPISITGTFTSGQAYTFTVSAVNANGTGASSQITSQQFSGAATIGYMMGGQNASESSAATYNANITKYTMSNDTNAIISASMSTAKSSGVGLGQRGPSGSCYSIGGLTAGGGFTSGISKLAIATETTSTPAATLTVTSQNTVSFYDSGLASGMVATLSNSGACSRLTYATDSLATLTAFPYTNVFNGGVALNGDDIHSYCWITISPSGGTPPWTHAGYRHTVSNDTWATTVAPYMTNTNKNYNLFACNGYGDTTYGYALTQGSTTGFQGVGRFTYSTTTWAIAVSTFNASEWTQGGAAILTTGANWFSSSGNGYVAGGNQWGRAYPLSKTYKHNIAGGTMSEIASAYTNRGLTSGSANGY